MKLKEAKQQLKSKVPELAHRIAPIYRLLEWDWRDVGIPEEKDIAKTLNRLINLLCKDSLACGTGGLWVRHTKEEDGEDDFTIGFELCEHIYSLDY